MRIESLKQPQLKNDSSGIGKVMNAKFKQMSLFDEDKKNTEDPVDVNQASSSTGNEKTAITRTLYRAKERPNTFSSLQDKRCELSKNNSEPHPDDTEPFYLIPPTEEGRRLTYPISLETQANQIFLCSGCQKKLTYEDEEDFEKHIEKLFEQKRSELKTAGIYITNAKRIVPCYEKEISEWKKKQH